MIFDVGVLKARQEVQKAFDCYQIESTKDTGFADDIALISEGLAQVQQMLTN